MDGKGTFWWPDGQKYVGETSKNDFEGYGELIVSKGNQKYAEYF